MATSPQPVVFEAKNCFLCFMQSRLWRRLPIGGLSLLGSSDWSPRTARLLVVVLVAVVVTGPVVPDHFSVSWRGSACAGGAAPLCNCTLLCFLWCSPVCSGPPCGCTVLVTNLAIQSGIMLSVFLTICPRSCYIFQYKQTSPNYDIQQTSWFIYSSYSQPPFGSMPHSL